MAKILDWIDKNTMIAMVITGVGSMAAGVAAAPLLMMEKTSGNLLGFTSLFLGGTTLALAVRELFGFCREVRSCETKSSATKH